MDSNIVDGAQFQKLYDYYSKEMVCDKLIVCTFQMNDNFFPLLAIFQFLKITIFVTEQEGAKIKLS